MPASHDVNARKSRPFGVDMTSLHHETADGRSTAVQHAGFATPLPPAGYGIIGMQQDSKQAAAFDSPSSGRGNEFARKHTFGESTAELQARGGRDVARSSEMKVRIGESTVQQTNAVAPRIRRFATSDVIKSWQQQQQPASPRRRSAAGGEGGGLVVGWNKRPRYYRENEGATTRDWRTNMMRVWGKRSGDRRSNVADDDIETESFVIRK